LVNAKTAFADYARVINNTYKGGGNHFTADQVDKVVGSNYDEFITNRFNKEKGTRTKYFLNIGKYYDEIGYSLWLKYPESRSSPPPTKFKDTLVKGVLTRTQAKKLYDRLEKFIKA